MGVNRPNKRKDKKGGGCKMCKPHKGKWAPFFKPKEKALREEDYEQDVPKRITPRVQKGVAGNWGHPRKWLKRHTEIKPNRVRLPSKTTLCRPLFPMSFL